MKMIIVSIDGVNFNLASKMLTDIFPEQTMKKIHCDVRRYSDTPEKGQPTTLGLACMWSGDRIRNLDKNIFNRLNPVNKTQEEDNYAINYIDRNGKPLDLVFNHFDRCKLFISGHGQNPHCDMKEHFIFFSEVPNAREVPCEELAVPFEVCKDDYDLFWIHTSVVKTATAWPGPYEQGRIPSLIPYDTIRKDRELKKKVFEFGVMRYKYLIRCMQEAKPNDIIIVTTDHGSMIDEPFTPNQIDDIFVIVNRKINLDDTRFQWDVKSLILRLKEYDRKN